MKNLESEPKTSQKEKEAHISEITESDQKSTQEEKQKRVFLYLKLLMKPQQPSHPVKVMKPPIH